MFEKFTNAEEAELYACVYGLDMIRHECATYMIKPYHYYTKMSIYMFLPVVFSFWTGNGFIAAAQGNMAKYFP